jgi:gluconolactonase
MSIDDPTVAESSRIGALAHNGVVALALFTALVLGATALPAGTPAREVIGRVERLDPRLDGLVAPGAVLERISVGHEWAEGPVWDARDGSLLFSDVPRNVVLRWSEGAGITPFLRASGYQGKAQFAGREPGSNGLAFDRAGRLLLCQHGERRIVRLERNGKLRVLVDSYRGKRLNSPNDLVIAPNGDLYFTDPPFGLPKTFADPKKELAFSGVYRLSANGGLTLLTRELEAPNGIGLSPDGRWLYVSNAVRERPVWVVYPVQEDGQLGPGREFASARDWMRKGEGLPDGLKIDREGNLFAAGPGGIHVFAPDGTRLGRIETGVPTGNVAWGGDGSVLYVAANRWIARIQTTTRGSGL